jgi:hypothetical protein
MLQIGVQPPSRTVYQRLLKPYPSVYLIVPPLPSGQEATGAVTPLLLSCQLFFDLAVIIISHVPANRNAPF